MNDKEQLGEIKDRISKLFGYETAKDDAMYYMKKKHINWLLEQAEKVEYWRKQHRKRCNELEDAYFKIQLIENQLHQAQAKAERYEKAIKECIDRMNGGGSGTRSFIYEKLREVMEGTE